jgi:hypothetical protein
LIIFVVIGVFQEIETCFRCNENQSDFNHFDQLYRNPEEPGSSGNFARGGETAVTHTGVPTSSRDALRQRRLLEGFARVSGGADEPASRSRFDKAKKLF